jgi:triacylglycerol lipase
VRQSADGGISPAALSRLVTRDLPHIASGLVIEAAWAVEHMVMYPLGLLSAPARVTNGPRHHNLSGLSPEQRGLFHFDVAAAETPILLVHGIIDNHGIFTVMERSLRRRGFQTLSAYDYGLLTHNIPRAAVRFGEAIQNLSTATGYERIHVIGHSLGGLIARY